MNEVFMKKKKNNMNPLIKDQKRIKSINVGSEDENEIKRFIIIVLVISVLVGIVYGVTELLKKEERNTTVAEGEIDYNVLSVGMLLNRPEKEYYVLIYDKEDSDAVLYSELINSYMTSKDSLKIYYCDLGNKLNRDYYNVNNDNKSNPNAKSIKELDLGELTLIKVEKGKITKYIEKYDSIKNELK
jgi:hypothetical protein